MGGACDFGIVGGEEYLAAVKEAAGAVAETVPAQFIIDVFNMPNFFWCRDHAEYYNRCWNEIENRIGGRLYMDNPQQCVDAETYELFVDLIDIINKRFGACFPKRPFKWRSKIKKGGSYGRKCLGQCVQGMQDRIP